MKEKSSATKIFQKVLFVVFVLLLSYFIHSLFPFLDKVTPYLADEKIGGVFWVYSTLAQSIAALFAVSGMFVVFRLQVLQTEMIAYFNSDAITYYTAMKYPGLSFEEIKEKLIDRLHEKDPQVVTARAMLSKRDELKDGMKNSLRELGALFLLSISMMYIPFCKSCYWILSSILILTLVAIVIILRNIGMLIYKSLD